jgi:hypothetical protein
MADTSTNSWKLLYETGRQALQARKLQEAEQSFSAALQLAEDFPAGDPRLVATLNALARIYSLQRRYLAAAALLNRLLEVTERTLGNNHVQVAGVLTNLAEMYTHLGAAREELELRERVLAIRADDPNADANALQRLRERVAELHAQLSAQEATVEEEEEIEPLPTVRTSEYSAPIEMSIEPETTPALVSEPVAPKFSEPVVELTEALSTPLALTSQLAVAPWPGAVSTGTTPTDARSIDQVESSAFVGESRRPALSLGVEIIDVAATPSPMSTSMEHGFSDMGRDELVSPVMKKISSRSSLYSIAAGVVLVAGILAARGFVGGGSDDERGVAGGSVNLAANAPAGTTTSARVISRPASPVTTPPVDPRMVERLVAERRGEQSGDRAEEPRAAASGRSGQERDVIVPRIPASIDVDRTIKGLDGAVKAIDQRAKAAADSLSTIRLQAPTFSKTKIADPQQEKNNNN